MEDATRPIVSGHQPVYLPWLGLFHKLSLCDVFVFMDDVQYLRQDWNNRNRIKSARGPIWLTVPVTLKASDGLVLRNIRIDSSRHGTRHDWQLQHWKAIRLAYANAPHWDRYAAALESLYTATRWNWLVDLAFAQLVMFLAALELTPRIVIASEAGFAGRKSDLVLDHCRRFDARACVLGTHGRDYIVDQDFIDRGTSLHFQSYRHPVYPQRFGDFAPFLSVIDLLFNCGPASRDILLSGNVTRAQIDGALGDVAAVIDPMPEGRHP